MNFKILLSLFFIAYVLLTLGCRQGQTGDVENAGPDSLATPTEIALLPELGIPRSQFINQAGLDSMDSTRVGFEIVDNRFADIDLEEGCCEIWRFSDGSTLIISYGIRSDGEIRDFVLSYRLWDKLGKVLAQKSL